MKRLPFLFIACLALPLSGAETSLSLAHVWTGEADLDAGGELGTSSTRISAGLDWDLGRGQSAGVSLDAAYNDYDFSGSAGLGALQPWGGVGEYGASLNWRRPVGDAGMLFVAPSLQAAREDGADWGDSLSYGAIASYGHRFSDTLTLGLGIGVFSGLEETDAFPVLMIDWRINEQWRVGNPLRPGPTGPAGIELAYAVSPSLEVGIGGAWRSNRFRLDDSGVAPGGIGEVEGFPAFLRLTWQASDTVSVDLFGGMLFRGEVTLEDHAGHEISSDDLDDAPLAALSVTAKF